MKKFFIQLRNDFLTGIIIILPIYITYQILKFLLLSTNSLILEPLTRITKPFLPEHYITTLVKVSAFLTVIIFITLLGLATKFILVRRLMAQVEKLILKIPMINKIYSTTKDMSQVFLGHETKGFTKVVALEYPRKGVYAIGFITNQKTWNDKLRQPEELNSVFVPTTPNPTSGMLLLVPRSQIIPLDISVAEGLKAIISGGAAPVKIQQSQKDGDTDI